MQQLRRGELTLKELITDPEDAVNLNLVLLRYRP